MTHNKINFILEGDKCKIIEIGTSHQTPLSTGISIVEKIKLV